MADDAPLDDDDKAEHRLEGVLATKMLKLDETHWPLIADEIERRAVLFERFYRETAETVGMGPRALAMASLLEDLNAGWLWA